MTQRRATITAPDLPTFIGQRAEKVEWELLDSDLSVVDVISPWQDSVPGIRHDTTAEVIRVVNGFTLSEVDASEIDMLTARLRPTWVMDDSTRHPMGVFMFAASDNQLRHNPAAAYRTCTLYDQSTLLADKRREAYGLTAGAGIADAITELMDEVGIVDVDVDGGGAITGGDLAWPAGTPRSKILRHLAAIGSFYRPHFNNDGCAVVRRTEDLDSATPTVSYTTLAGGRMHANTLIYVKDLFNAPNVFVVIGTGGNDSEITGSAFVPATQPHSLQNRGREVVEEIRMQGISSTAAAVQAAKAAAAQHLGDFVTFDFDAAPDPRHDTFDIVAVDNVNYREVAWNLRCAPGGPHSHSLRQAYNLVDSITDTAPSGVGPITP